MITGLIISDLHVGSAFAIFPDNFRLSSGGMVSLNDGQLYLLDCWNHMLDNLPRKFGFLIINGDVTDGVARKDLGRYIVEPDQDFQIRAAVKLIEPLAKRARFTYVSKGTPYHAGLGSSADEVFAERIGAVPDEWGHFASTWRVLSVEGIDIDFSHHRSISIRNDSAPLEREIQFDAMAAELKGGRSDLIVRSHGHRYAHLNIDGELGIHTPSWSLQTSFAQMSKSPNRLISRLVGGVRVNLFPSKKNGDIQDAADYIDVLGLVYPHPRVGKSIHGGG